MITATTDTLAPLSLADRDVIATLPRDRAAHDAHMASLATMTQIETADIAGAPLPMPLTIAAWNLERCLFPQASTTKLRDSEADVVLLSELDNGMARTDQRHPTAEIAQGLGMSYAFGVEFIELGLGSETERAFCRDDVNWLGLHGNAVLARTALKQVFMLRLPGSRHWFLNGGDQPRMGERMAIGGVVQTSGGPLVVVSTHLESVAGPARRAAQMAAILDALDAGFPGMAAVIGGDLNTGNFPGGIWRDETLFSEVVARGYAVHGGPEDAPTTRASLITRWPDRAMKLDWFLTRGVKTGLTRIEPSLDTQGRPLSDHDLVVLSVSAFD